MADVPVPETAKANDRSSARNTRASRARTSSMISTNWGSRWLSIGAPSAVITLGDIRLGPGPRRIRSLEGNITGLQGVPDARILRVGAEKIQLSKRGANGVDGCLRHRLQRRTRIPALETAERDRRLQSGDAILRADEF